MRTCVAARYTNGSKCFCIRCDAHIALDARAIESEVGPSNDLTTQRMLHALHTRKRSASTHNASSLTRAPWRRSSAMLSLHTHTNAYTLACTSTNNKRTHLHTIAIIPTSAAAHVHACARKRAHTHTHSGGEYDNRARSGGGPSCVMGRRPPTASSKARALSRAPCARPRGGSSPATDLRAGVAVAALAAWALALALAAAAGAPLRTSGGGGAENGSASHLGPEGR